MVTLNIHAYHSMQITVLSIITMYLHQTDRSINFPNDIIFYIQMYNLMIQWRLSEQNID